ncbi:hypothetical protein CEUSTIGMA_g594.t1 [Chlamydomonas eustigma]|uniref:Protein DETOXIFICATION n=1 Tax=Chlamydomonas eustigma TaxID=1157962 RepID=A0A250WQR7_9CHLO|nr:hypothetical protein CEUSTIGMA_g594.t1 [Chlamydomonas eustigma]|eukprot:GAX73141.1 hypothetical protein CEUSTIGMA_g594.t1 [Chlamydomonas eustigma]
MIETVSSTCTFWEKMTQSLRQQMCMAGPLMVNLVSINVLATVNLFFVAQYGTDQLAAAALGNNISIMFSKLVLLGLCGALDTQASQAVGAGRLTRLPTLYQRTTLFLLVHCIPITAIMLGMPVLLSYINQDSASALPGMVSKYMLFIVPGVFLEAISRPLSRILVAKRVAAPLMIIALTEVPINVFVNYLLVVHFNLQYLGAALSLTVASAVDLVLMLVYVSIWEQSPQLIAFPRLRALKRWRTTARLSYPSCFMKCAESWAFTVMTLAASLLPNPEVAVAAVGLSYNVYGILFITFVAFSMASCAQVGNQLGAGDPVGAQASAAAAVTVAPIAWLVAAVPLLYPPCQDLLIRAFSDPNEGVDPRLHTCLAHMFQIVSLLILFDGVQTIMSGVVQALGCQHRGALVNAVAFYIFGVPAGLYLAFGAGLGAEGLYLGMVAGPAIQSVSYGVMLIRTDWDKYSKLACVSEGSADCLLDLSALLSALSQAGLRQADDLLQVLQESAAAICSEPPTPVKGLGIAHVNSRALTTQQSLGQPLLNNNPFSEYAAELAVTLDAPSRCAPCRFTETEIQTAVDAANKISPENASVGEVAIVALAELCSIQGSGGVVAGHVLLNSIEQAVSLPSSSPLFQRSGSYAMQLSELLEDVIMQCGHQEQSVQEIAAGDEEEGRSRLPFPHHLADANAAVKDWSSGFYTAASGAMGARPSMMTYSSLGFGADQDTGRKDSIDGLFEPRVYNEKKGTKPRSKLARIISSLNLEEGRGEPVCDLEEQQDALREGLLHDEEKRGGQEDG